MTHEEHVREEVISRYRVALQAVRDEAGTLRFRDVVAILEPRIDQLSSVVCNEELASHARQTIRSLGGMEGIGDVGRNEQTCTYLDSIERLYHAAKAVLALWDDPCGRQSG
jgi:hypothetical protein